MFFAILHFFSNWHFVLDLILSFFVLIMKYFRFWYYFFQECDRVLLCHFQLLIRWLGLGPLQFYIWRLKTIQFILIFKCFLFIGPDHTFTFGIWKSVYLAAVVNMRKYIKCMNFIYEQVESKYQMDSMTLKEVIAL